MWEVSNMVLYIALAAIVVLVAVSKVVMVNDEKKANK